MLSKGICWIDDCRIPFVDENINFDRPRIREKNLDWILTGSFTFENPDVKEYNSQGRFPANILICDDILNDGSTTKGSGHKIPKRTNNSKNVLNLKTYHREAAYEDKGTNSRYYDIDKWFDKILNNE